MTVSMRFECLTKTPMGDQTSTFAIEVDGDTFTGTNAGPMGSLVIQNGKVDGDNLTWSMDMTVPMPMTLECKATIAGDSLIGTVNAGMFGDMAMSGTRLA
jgi:hypothetical protein